MTNDGVPVEAFGGDCHREECGHPTPWDMSAIVVNREDVYCSPTCARAAFDDDAEIDTLALHDPQRHVEWNGKGAEGMIGCIVQPNGHARQQLDEFAAMFPE